MKRKKGCSYVHFTIDNHPGLARRELQEEVKSLIAGFKMRAGKVV